MKRAVYYARVSTSSQEERGTIESQKNELIKQINNDGNTLVEEYIDNGWSGGRLDRPALDKLRNDLKTDLFDVVYFLDSDRIARDINYQRIIISELLKCNKEIYIKGKNYIHNPENKLTLTVLGAANEFEKAKITERMMRGRKEKARRGAIVDNGCPFGYTHIKKTETKDGYLVINEEKADVVRFIFNSYAKTDISLNGLCKLLEKRGHKTATGKNYWKSEVIKCMLVNTSYYGSHIFNKTYKVEPRYKNSNSQYAKSIKTTARLKDKSEWIEILVPKIINKKIFDIVQKKLKQNSKLKRNNKNRYLLSGLIRCGCCNHTYSGVNWKGVNFYKCNYRDKRYNHIKEAELMNCNNSAVKGEVIEHIIDKTIREKIIRPTILTKYINYTNGKKETNTKRHFAEVNKLDSRLSSLKEQGKRILDLYAENNISKDDYIIKANEIKQKIIDAEKSRNEIMYSINTSKEKKELKVNIKTFCKEARWAYDKLDNKIKSQVIKKIIDEIIIYKNNGKNKLLIRGVIPVKANKNKTLSDQSVKLLPMYCQSNTRGSMMR
ncbi:recombinase family protein [bacterium]|nr:recombinase family protein [bacterium]